MLDLPQWVALAIAWVGAWIQQVTPHEVVKECHCNCTCEVTQATCPEEASWTYELFKCLTVGVFGVVIGTGKLLKAIFLGGKVLSRWLHQSPSTRPAIEAPGISSGSSLTSDISGGQRGLALHQLEVLRQRRLAKS